MVERAARLLRHIYWRLFLAPFGYGRRFPAEQWDDQYRSGKWDYLDSIDQLGHYAVIAGYVRHLNPSAAILELGCGNGLLVRYLEGMPLASYVGIDLSEEAVERARALAARTVASFPCRFRVGDFESQAPGGEFDLVVFAESIYYATRPLETLLRYSSALREGGSIIISMYRYKNTAAIWKQIESRFSVEASVRLENARAQEWDIKVLRVRRIAADSG